MLFGIRIYLCISLEAKSIKVKFDPINLHFLKRLAGYSSFCLVNVGATGWGRCVVHVSVETLSGSLLT